jgi:SPP1 family predicted phage head-tail adaptor
MVHQIRIQRQQASSDISGATTVWVDFLACRGAIDPVRGADVIKSGQDTTQLFSIVTIWWQAGILPNMRLVANGRTHIIQSADDPGERHVILKLNCLALGNQ